MSREEQNPQKKLQFLYRKGAAPRAPFFRIVRIRCVLQHVITAAWRLLESPLQAIMR